MLKNELSLGATKSGVTSTLKNDLVSLQQQVKDFSENYSKIKVESNNHEHLDVPAYDGEDDDFAELDGEWLTADLIQYIFAHI